MKNRRGFFLGATAALGAAALMSCAPKPSDAPPPTESFIVLYPSQEGARFDMEYYRDSHIPLVARVMNPANVILVEGAPLGDAAAPYVMIAHFQFASAEDLDAALAKPEMAEIRADVPAFTDIRPTVMRGGTP